jgi:hypothetical protein
MFFGGAVLEFKLKALHLLGSTLPLGSCPPALFDLSIFQVGSHIYAQADPWTLILLLASCVASITGATPGLLIEMGSC